MSAQEHLETFLREAEDLLAKIEEICLALEGGQAVDDDIHRLFRAFHTIKGCAAMFGFEAVAGFTHHVESVLDHVRAGTLPISRELCGLMLAARDHIAGLLAASEHGSAPPAEAGAERIIAALATLDPSAQPARATPTPQRETASAPPSSTARGALQRFRIRFRPPAGMLAAGTDPARLFDELRSLGQTTVVADTVAVPCMEALRGASDRCHFRWEITLTTDHELNAIRDVFIFVEDGGELLIEPLSSTDPGERRAFDSAASASSSPIPESPAAPHHPRAALPAVPGTEFRQPAATTVRVASERLDRLVGLVGELVINQSRLAQATLHCASAELATPVEELERLVSAIRESVLGIRMMPIGSTFSRFKRLVHDLSANLGKDIDLITEGAETELDKNVLDQLGEPLVHLIRNSIDHGIDTPADRLRLGKPPRGTIRLSASHSGSAVAITIHDDGRGIDVDAVRARAVERNLIPPDGTLSRAELLNLIFLPGFSTAKQVTDVSGRGVGMDVVKRQVEALRGSIQLASETGRGTTISLTLPLTLAIIEGLLVEVAGDRFIVPLASVLGTIELPPTASDGDSPRHLVAVRGELIPYVDLCDVFGFRAPRERLAKVVIVRHEGQRVGFVVDHVLGSQQTVIQSLGRVYRHVDVASGATILGDGRVALILDVAGIVHAAGRLSS